MSFLQFRLYLGFVEMQVELDDNNEVIFSGPRVRMGILCRDPHPHHPAHDLGPGRLLRAACQQVREGEGVGVMVVVKC